MTAVTAAAPDGLTLPRIVLPDERSTPDPAHVTQEDHDALALAVAQMVDVTQRTLALSHDAEARLDLVADRCTELERAHLWLMVAVGVLAVLLVLVVGVLA